MMRRTVSYLRWGTVCLALVLSWGTSRGRAQEPPPPRQGEPAVEQATETAGSPAPSLAVGRAPSLAVERAPSPAAHASSSPAARVRLGPAPPPYVTPPAYLGSMRSRGIGENAQSGARFLIAGGVGLMVSGLVHGLAAGLRERCGQKPTVPRVGAGFVGGVGLALTLGGGVWLSRRSPSEQVVPSSGEYFGLFGTALGAATISQLLLFSLHMASSAGACSS